MHCTNLCKAKLDGCMDTFELCHVIIIKTKPGRSHWRFCQIMRSLFILLFKLKKNASLKTYSI